MICSKCLTDKPAEEFTFDGFVKATGERRRRKKCRTCMRELCKQWRTVHKDHYLHYNKVVRKEREAAKSLPADDKAIPEHVVVPPAHQFEGSGSSAAADQSPASFGAGEPGLDLNAK